MQVPLGSIATVSERRVPLVINHQGQFPAATLSFNLAPGKSLSDATAAIEAHMRDLRAPATIHGEFAGAAKSFQSSSSRQPLLILRLGDHAEQGTRPVLLHLQR